MGIEPRARAGLARPASTTASWALAAASSLLMWSAADVSGAASDHADHSEETSEPDRHDQDDERVQVERRAERDRLDDVLKQAVREDDDDEHDRCGGGPLGRQA